MTPKPRAVAMTLDFALLRGAVEEIPFGVATMRGTELTYANAALERTFGAPSGGLERASLGTLFGPADLAEIERALDEQRFFDGRIRGKGLDGRAFDAEVHVERYTSESAGIGGFLVARDVTLELGAIGRLLDLLGGSMFRWRVDHASAKVVSSRRRDKRAPRSPLEYVSPAIARLTGLDADACAAHPELLANFVTAEERDRLAFLYRRLAHGDVATASAQVNLQLADGRIKLLNLRGTGRRDTSGVVRHIEGVVTEAVSPLLSTPPESDQTPLPSTSKPPRMKTDIPGDGFAEALLDMAEQVLREADQHHQTLGREVRLLRGAFSQIGPAADDASSKLERITACASGAASFTRRVRRAMRRGAGNVTVGDLIETLRSTLAPSFGEAPLVATAAPGARDLLLRERTDELTLALLHVSLRTFRLAGSGSLRVHASVDDARDVVIEIVARGTVEHESEVHASTVTELNELRDTARGVVETLGGTVLCELSGPGEIRLAVHLPRSPVA